MAQQVLGLTFRVPVTVTSTNAAASHPASNAALLPHKWRRTTRSTSAGAGWYLQLDFGGAVALDGVYLNVANFSAVQFAKSDNASSWTDLYASPTTVPSDDRCAPPTRRKGWFPASGWTSSFANRYLRVLPSSADPGATYWELGAVACPVTESMTRNWGTPFRHRTIEPVTRLEYAGRSGSEVNVEAPPRVGFTLQGGPWVSTALPQLQRLRRLGQNAPFFLFENRGDASKAYLLQRMAETEFAERYAVFDAGWEFEECS